MPKTPSKFPLFRHQNGQWAKKILGRLHYFGKDQSAALKRFVAEQEDLYAGRTPRAPTGDLTLGDMCNHFLESKRLMVDSGELSPRTWRDYYDAAKTLVEVLGKDRQVSDLDSDDFKRLRTKFSKGSGPVRVGNRIQHTRTIFKFAWEDGILDSPVRFGSLFKKPSRKNVRASKLKRGSKVLSREECRALIDTATCQLKAMILLGLNCAFGQSDLSSLPRAAIDLKSGWVDFPRPKTSIPRRCPLWAETVEALRAIWRKRHKAKNKADAGLVFITKYGNPWVRFVEREPDKKGRERRAVGIDSVTLEFGKLLVSLGIKRKGIGPYALRHTFRTIADRAKDQPAADHIMGHSSESMAANYRDRVDDDRLQAVVNVVRDWLFLPHDK